MAALLVAVPLAAEDDERVMRRRARINRRVERVEQKVARLMDRYCTRYAGYQERYGSDLPSFCEGMEPEPTPTPTPEPSATPTPTPTPSPSVASVLISEVYYDVDDSHGTESANEWVELYNTTGSEIDLSGYMIGDATGTDTLPDGTTIAANGYLVITNNASTGSFWALSAGLVALDSALGSNGLSNTGDAVMLKDASDTMVDAMSYGSNTDAFDPAVPATIEGYSLERISPGVDTNTASDWQALITPTPGVGN